MRAARGCAQQLLLPASAGICRGTRASEAARPDFHRPSSLRQPPAPGGAVAGGGFSWPPARAAADEEARAVGGQAEAEHQQAASRAQGLPLPSCVALASDACRKSGSHVTRCRELPEVPDRLLPDKLAITFLTNRDGNIVSLSASLEPMVKDIVFVRLAAGDCTLAAFR